MADSHSIRLAGAGVHSGQMAVLELSQRPIDSAHSNAEGPRFLFPGFQNMSITDLGRLNRRAERSTILYSEPGLQKGSGATLRTVEHLLAALLFFSKQRLDVHSDAAEVPGLDGSAVIFRDTLTQLFPDCMARPVWQEYPSDLKWEHEWGNGYIRVRPAPGFRIRYSLDRPPLQQSYMLEDPAIAWKEILPARSFVFYREWEQGLAAGQMLGAGPDSGLLLAESESQYREMVARHSDFTAGPYPLLNQPNWRMENEAVKHKILDLLGDLALAGLALPKLDIEICNGGHSIHHMLLEKLSLN